MIKHTIFSMILVICSTLFLVSFYAAGLYLLDMQARNNSPEVVETNATRYSKEHSALSKRSRSLDSDTSVFFRLKEPITMAFAGDVMMEGSIEKAMKNFDINYPFLQIQKELEKADYAVVNLETAVTKKDIPYDKQFNFRTGPESLVALKQAGFNMVSLANNHTMDYGEKGLLDTIDYLDEVGLAYVGAGRNSDEAYAEQIIEIKGKKIAILGFSRVLPSETWYATPTKPGIASGYQVDRMVQIIEETRKSVDYLFVFMHWGLERQQTPEPYQLNDARAMIDAGADGVIGAHPHVIQGLDYYKGKPIAYSLGNFLFPDYVSGITAESCLLTLIIQEDEIVMNYTPLEITGNQVALISPTKFEERLNTLEKLSFDVKRDGTLFYSK
ncbi:MAG: CapA family protein [Anaerobacillus sp.]|uniref:CapA family protein n=1 Tax=Anaerobacillus sp. TaxID=1872506 RepID=UPI00391B6DD4